MCINSLIFLFIGCMLVIVEQLRLELGGEFREITPEEQRRMLLRDMERRVLMDLRLGFRSKVLDVLEDPDAKANEIESLKSLIDKEILMRLFDMSNAFYFGKLRVGDTVSFFDITMRLGMKQTKILILALSFFSVTKDRELRLLAARAFATLMFCRILSVEANYKKEIQEKLELGGLMYEIGKVVMFLYRKYHARFPIRDEFIEAHHHAIGLKVVDKFRLPGFLKEIMIERHIRLDEESFGIPGIIYMVNSMVDQSFRRYGKLILTAPSAGPEKYGASTCGSVILEQFTALGFGDLVEIHPPAGPVIPS